MLNTWYTSMIVYLGECLTVLFRNLESDCSLKKMTLRFASMTRQDPNTFVRLNEFTLPKTNSSPQKMGRNTKGNWSSNHHFSGNVFVFVDVNLPDQTRLPKKISLHGFLHLPFPKDAFNFNVGRFVLCVWKTPGFHAMFVGFFFRESSGSSCWMTHSNCPSMTFIARRR